MAKGKKKVSTGKADEAVKVDFRDLLDMREKNPYGTSDAKEFENKIADWSIVDLQELAVKAGISCGGGVTVLRENLKKEFNRYLIRNKPLSADVFKEQTYSPELLAKIDAIMAG